MRNPRSHKSHLKLLLATLAVATCVPGLTAGAQPQKTSIIRHKMNPPWEAVNGYTQVVEANGVVYLSGVACSGETYAQAVPDCYRQLKVILDKLNLTPEDIVKETVFTKDIEAFKEQIPARKAFYGKGKYPAATWIGISRLYLPEMVAEIDTIAVRKK